MRILKVDRPFTLLGLVFLVGGVLWITPAPPGLELKTWHLFTLLVTTLLGLTVNPLPVAAMSLLGMTAALMTKTLTLPEALSGFSSEVVWLIVFAFVIARGFIKTGLGARIAYYFIYLLGRSSLGLSYGLVLSELVLAPVIPSVTARGGGIVLPIASALANEFQSKPNTPSRQRLGAFLIKVCFQGNVITSAMFITAMAGNPLAAKLASELGIVINWSTWALAAFVPGMLNLALAPLLVYWLYPPEIKYTPEAPQLAKERLRQMGRLTSHEILMMGVFAVLLCLWLFGSVLHVPATTAALIGVILLLVTRVLEWEDVVKEKEAWSTFVSFAILLMMTTFLAKFGMMQWVNNHLKGLTADVNSMFAIIGVCLLYFYVHYLFASVTAHITFLFSSFLLALISLQVPPLVAALLLAVLANLSGSLTQYGNGTAPVFFGAGFVPIKDWLRLGLILSTFNFWLWMSFGPLWWKVLGWW